MQHMSEFSPFFYITAFYESPNVANHYFPNTQQLTRPVVETAYLTMRREINMVQVKK
jgi:hypothetical protein